jgi:hypothetical protein
LEGFDLTIIRYVVAEVLEEGENWILSVDTYFAPPREQITGDLAFSLETENEPIRLSNMIILDEPNEFGEVVNTTNITVPKVGRYFTQFAIAFLQTTCRLRCNRGGLTVTAHNPFTPLVCHSPEVLNQTPNKSK